MIYLTPSNSNNDTNFKEYYYDVNSMYPYCMLNDMPVGQPTLSNDTNLNNYFGFCYADIIPNPELKVPLIPWRNDKGEIEYPSTSFSILF